MKVLLYFLPLAAVFSQVNAAKLNVTILYETLCPTCFSLFRTQVPAVLKDDFIVKNVFFELVPFGKADWTENPWSITCQHGPEECRGNVMNACFIERTSDNLKQMLFVFCTMYNNYPPNAGTDCAKELGFDYTGVEECISNDEGRKLQIKNGKRTKSFPLTWVPTIIYDNVYNKDDSEASENNFKDVILKKLKAKGVLPEY